MRVVVDTNVLVAGMAYPSGPPGRIVAAWRSGALEVVVSPWILNECARVLVRLRPMAHLSESEVAEWVDALAFAAELVDPDTESLEQASDAGLRDAADEPVLAVLLASGADLLVTGDKDLLALAQRYPILTPAEFCVRHAP
jgi:putative PIN family toxin of toxin-antitoxin system